MSVFFTAITKCYDLFVLPMTVYGFTFTYLDIVIFVSVVSIIIWVVVNMLF